MDSLKLVPQVFFDLIGRVVPGALAIVACLLLSRTTWESWLSVTMGESIAKDSLPVAILIFFALAYVAGQFISPAAKLVQRIGELKCFHPVKKAAGYDKLRLRYPEVGAHCAKIRAEFTMHNGIAVVLLASAVLYPLTNTGWHWLLFIVLVSGAILSGYRGKETRDTFNKTVTQFEEEVTKLTSEVKPVPSDDRAKAAAQSVG